MLLTASDKDTRSFTAKVRICSPAWYCAAINAVQYRDGSAPVHHSS